VPGQHISSWVQQAKVQSKPALHPGRSVQLPLGSLPMGVVVGLQCWMAQGSHGEPMAKPALLCQWQRAPTGNLWPKPAWSRSSLMTKTDVQTIRWDPGCQVEALGELSSPSFLAPPPPKGGSLATQFFKAAVILSLTELSPAMHYPPSWKCQPLGCLG
jgi:hypothetical protein